MTGGKHIKVIAKSNDKAGASDREGAFCNVGLEYHGARAVSKSLEIRHWFNLPLNEPAERTARGVEGLVLYPTRLRSSALLGRDSTLWKFSVYARDEKYTKAR
jgi:hypothetical protein